MNASSDPPLRRGLTVGLAVFFLLGLLTLLLFLFFPSVIAFIISPLLPLLWGCLAVLAGACFYFHIRIEAPTLRMEALSIRLSKLEAKRDRP